MQRRPGEPEINTITTKSLIIYFADMPATTSHTASYQPPEAKLGPRKAKGPQEDSQML